jgi:hypothetical protein
MVEGPEKTESNYPEQLSTFDKDLTRFLDNLSLPSVGIFVKVNKHRKVLQIIYYVINQIDFNLINKL